MGEREPEGWDCTYEEGAERRPGKEFTTVTFCRFGVVRTRGPSQQQNETCSNGNVSQPAFRLKYLPESGQSLSVYC